MHDGPLPSDSEPKQDRQLWAMVLLSGTLHAGLILAALLFPRQWLQQPSPPLVSYTVDLIAPDKLGGNNMVQGGKGRIQAPPMTAVEVAKAARPAPREKPAAAAEDAPQPKAESAPPPVVVPPEPKAVPPKPEPKPAENAIALAEKTRPQPTITLPVPTATVDARAVAEAKMRAAEAKLAAEKAATAKAAAEKAAATKAALEKAAAEKAVAEKLAAEKAATKAAADKLAAEKAAAKAAADKLAAEKAAAKVVADKLAAERAAAEKEAQAAGERDAQIAAAIRRVQQKGERGGGLGDKPADQAGGPIGAGPGDGIGGVVRGVDFVLYNNQMSSRLRASWAWAGTNESLIATVRFSITETGEITDVKIIKSSGDRGYDASVERAVRAVSPLPPPPELYRKDFSDVEVDFTPNDLKM